MNKFVKGAKNLAFALSFVTVAACGNVKKADLDDALKSFEEKMDGKLKGKADNGTVDENQSYVRRSDLSNFVKSGDLDGKIDGLGKDVESLKGVFKKGDLREMSSIFGDVIGSVVDFSKYEINVGKMESTAGKIVVEVKDGDGVVYKDLFGGAAFAADEKFDENLKILKLLVGGKGSVVFNKDNVFKNTANKMQFGDCADVNTLFVEVCKLLNVLGVTAEQCGLDKLFVEKKVLNGTAGNFDLSCAKLVSGLNAFAGSEVCKVKGTSPEDKVVVLLGDVFGGKKNDEISVRNA